MREKKFDLLKRNKQITVSGKRNESNHCLQEFFVTFSQSFVTNTDFRSAHLSLVSIARSFDTIDQIR